jgi:hypothetical protein
LITRRKIRKDIAAVKKNYIKNKKKGKGGRDKEKKKNI